MASSNALTAALYPVGFAIVLKITMGFDDMLFLSPFMARGNRMEKCSIGLRYVLAILAVTMIAAAVAGLLRYGLRKTSFDDRTLDEALAIIAASILAIFSLASAAEEGCFRECAARLRRRRPDASSLAPLLRSEQDTYKTLDEAEDSNKTRVLTDDDDPEDEADPVEPVDEAGSSGVNNILVVAFMGSLDDFIVYFSILFAGTFLWYEFVTGIFFGSVLIAFVVGCLLSVSGTATSCLKMVPIPLIYILVAVYILIEAFCTSLPSYV